MKKDTPQYNEMIQAVASGALTRQEACDKYQVSYASLGVWLSREGVKTGRKALGGVAAERRDAYLADLDKVKAAEAAVARVLAGESTVYAETRDNPNLNRSTLRLQVAKAQKAAGIVKADNHPGKPRTAEQAVEMVRKARADLARAEAYLEELIAG